MTRTRTARLAVALTLVILLIAGIVGLSRTADAARRIHVTAYFPNANGMYAGDEVRILGVPVGKIDQIEAQPRRVKVTFWYHDKYKVPANANAVILSPTLISARGIQLTPAYAGGPIMAAGAVIPQERTAVPVEWDEFRQQLEKLTNMLQPSQPGGVSTLGQFVDTAADNLRGQGASIRDSVIKLSAAISALGDHSGDLFSTIKNVSILVSALQSSTDLMRQLNANLAAVTALVSNNPDEIGNVLENINSAAGEVQSFVAENRETLGTTSDKLASITTAVKQSLDDLKQTLHIAPTTFQNFLNIYQPAQATLTGVLAANNFANPISFICGAIQAAARLGAEQSAKLCVQYLAPIVKNRQYNFPPLGLNPFVGTSARPNELTYSEDWLRPDYVPPPGQAPAPPPGEPPAPPRADALGGYPTETQPADAASGLRGLMVPQESHP
ncbi:MCE family protein [Mycobacterium vicinigordonae]|uniref:MCE family protein n=1 Tax=Mycobacterium vicinigordonae TaxID=1719132 RepID=A0A7D6HSD2_9MYCO|nr:MCE family protein [Mycobacterium vicinigordonae]QLL06252.1 MCE family protein [Mycobacterium vicinigordonae]